MIQAAIGFGAAVIVSILFPRAWARCVEIGRRGLVWAERIRILVVKE